MMQYDAKLNGEQKLEHFKSLRRNRSSNDKLLKEELRYEEKNEESLCRGSGEKVKRRAVIDSGTVRREKVQWPWGILVPILTRNESVVDGSLAIELLVYENSRKYRP